MPLAASSRIIMRDASLARDHVARHMAEHDLDVATRGDESRILFPHGHVAMRVDADALNVEASAETLVHLEDYKYFLASHLGELVADQEIDILWRGDGADRAGLPNFRVMRVGRVTDLTPRMRRLTLTGENLARFDTFENLHVKLYIPPRGVEPQWPSIASNGRMGWPHGDKKLADRRYTIRHIDVAAGTMDIDFVMHGDAGPGTAFALHARPGDPVGLMGPGGLGARAADWYLLVGDETALPAIARIVEALPAAAKAVVRIEIADGNEEQELHSAAALDVEWLHRNKASIGLEEAAHSVAWPADDRSVFAWVGCERDAFVAIRKYLRRERGLARDRHLAVAYWRREIAEGHSPKRLPQDA